MFGLKSNRNALFTSALNLRRGRTMRLRILKWNMTNEIREMRKTKKRKQVYTEFNRTAFTNMHRRSYHIREIKKR